MNVKLRTEVVRAMETIIRSLNDEELIMPWLVYGVADGDVTNNPENDDLDSYIEDDEDFSELMGLFADIMRDAHKDGLYVDGVLSQGYEDEKKYDEEECDEIE